MLAPNGVIASYRRMADPKLVCPAYPLMLKKRHVALRPRL